MKKRIISIFLALALMCGSNLSLAAASDGFAAAKGAVLIEASSGRVLYEKDSHEKLLNASTTKIMTAILTLEQDGLDDVFVVDPNAILVEGSSMGLQAGDQVTLRTLAWGMLLASGNDAANAAAVRIDKTLDAFVERMNCKAKDIGMNDTRFSSPSGLENGEHYTTAYDLALLSRYALQNDEFSEMVRSKSAKLFYGNPPYHRWLTNHNRLLWQSEDCIGIKTGFTKAAGRCLVSAAERNGLTLIAVTLNCPNDFGVHKTIYDQSFDELEFVDFEAMLGQLSVPVTGSTEQRVEVKALWAPGAYLTAQERTHVRLNIALERFIYAPAPEGQVVGRATVMLGEQTLSVTPLVTAQDRPARFPETRSIIQRVKDFFAFPQNYRFPLNEREGNTTGQESQKRTAKGEKT
ncbi:MAG TPA: D-alanyl-D-alanine carboxypeptidase family protein [Clostridia bacterium]|nr:D-alanyl-D-alanine carboxypeptidase family protein [Clostridia bacterium]